MPIELCDNNSCTGCGACLASCPHSAIYFYYDNWGFRYPKIDKSKCIECGSCTKKCPVLSPVKIEKAKECYLAWAKDDKIHLDCASGGVSYLLSKHIIEEGGFAVGCIWDDDFNAVITVIDSVDELNKTKGSKYVQSYIANNVYKEIKTRLLRGQKGIFIGLPCQVAAIKSLVNNNDGLILCDLLCHGGSSPKCHKEHLDYIRKKKRIKNVTDIKYRGGSYEFCYSLWNNKELMYVSALYADTYYFSFVKHFLFHESCYNCLFAKSGRVSDITVADFWGVDKTFISDKNILNGSNLVLIHSDKGNHIWKEISEKVVLYKRPLEEAINGNDTLRFPTDEPMNRQEVLKQIENDGFEKAIQSNPEFLAKRKIANRDFIRTRISLMIPKRLKEIIKKIVNK